MPFHSTLTEKFLSAFLDEKISLQEVIWLTTSPITALLQAQDIRKDVVSEYLGDIWFETIEEARTTLPGSPRQDRLMEFLTKLKAHPSPTQPAFMLDESELWSDLPMFGMEMRSAWNWEQGSDVSECCNLNAFVARLTATRTFDFALYAIWAMRDALETIEPSSFGLGLEPHIKAAAMWIEYAGEFIFHSRQVWEVSAKTGDPACGGTLWKGMPGFSSERWALWKKRFGELAGTNDLQEETRRLAERAANSMLEIEKIGRQE